MGFTPNLVSQRIGGGLPKNGIRPLPCPYAKRARTQKKIQIGNKKGKKSWGVNLRIRRPDHVAKRGKGRKMTSRRKKFLNVNADDKKKLIPEGRREKGKMRRGGEGDWMRKEVGRWGNREASDLESSETIPSQKKSRGGKRDLCLALKQEAHPSAQKVTSDEGKETNF